MLKPIQTQIVPIDSSVDLTFRSASARIPLGPKNVADPFWERPCSRARGETNGRPAPGQGIRKADQAR